MNPSNENETYKILDEMPWQTLEVLAIWKYRLRKMDLLYVKVMAEMDLAYAKVSAERDGLQCQVNELEQALSAKIKRIGDLEALSQKLEKERHGRVQRSKKGKHK